MNAELVLASIPRRLTAYAVDIVVAFVGAAAIQAVLFPVNPLVRAATSPSGLALHAWVTLTVTLPMILFFGLCWASPSGATLGMRLTHLRVCGAAGRPVSAAQALLRALVLLVPFEVNHAVLFHPQPIWDSPSPGFRVGFLAVYGLVLVYLGVALWTPTRQGPHDLAAGTIVSTSRGAA
jgi:uncharacterized RDD family membrane protein YckC